MRIVKIKGGTGNQLFQYAFALNLAKKTNDEVKLDLNSCQKCKDLTCRERITKFNISLETANHSDIKKNCLFLNRYPLSSFGYRMVSLFEIVFDKRYFFEKKKGYIDISSILNYSFYDGYWQSWKYPFNVESELIEELILKEETSCLTKATIDTIKKQNSVFIGIRRGDYVSTKTARNRYGSFSNNYYLNAMRFITDRIDNPVFYIFSNDIEWCKGNINFGDFNVVFREPNSQTSDIEELLIMANCKHAIILNSTFHWWGAFLIRNNNKIVIAPSEWFADGTEIDIIPPNWIKMKRNGELEE